MHNVPWQERTLTLVEYLLDSWVDAGTYCYSILGPLSLPKAQDYLRRLGMAEVDVASVGVSTLSIGRQPSAYSVAIITLPTETVYRYLPDNVEEV